MYDRSWLERFNLVDGVPLENAGTFASILSPETQNVSHSIPGLSVYRLLPLMIVSIFCSEIIIMLILANLPELPMVTEALVDSSMLLVILSPTFYFFHYRPLHTHHQERKKIIEQLVKSEERLHLALEAVNDGLWDWNIKNDNIYFSPRWISMLGYEDKRSLRKISSWSELIHPDDGERVAMDLKRHLDGRSTSFVSEFRMQTAWHDWKWILARGKVVERDDRGQPVRMVGTHTDIHARKKVEEALVQSEQNIRHLSRQLIKQSENEKKRIAQDLHDDFGQMLTALQLGIEMVQKQQFEDSQELEFHCARLLGTIDYLERELHSLCDNLRPVVLDDLGLAATLQWIAKELDRQTPGTAIKVKLNNQDKRLPADIELVFYRIAQEAMNNALKHANASRIDVELLQGERLVTLRISDNGSGFDKSGQKRQASLRWGLGLLGMHERAAAIGGNVVIKSTPGTGTIVECTAPHAEGAGGENELN